MKKRDQYLNTFVYIGRFQPFHIGHYNTLMNALNRANQVIIVIGGTDEEPKTFKNPFSLFDRAFMINSCLTKDERKRVKIIAATNYPGDDKLWASEIYEKVCKLANNSNPIKLIGHKKDESSFYLESHFPWPLIDVGTLTSASATKIRAALVADFDDILNQNLHIRVSSYLKHQTVRKHVRKLFLQDSDIRV